MNWPDDKKIVFCVRRMVRRMGLENLIDAFGRVAAGQPDAVLILAGKGPLLAELQSRANAIGLEGRIIFQGFIPDEDLPAAYSSADFSIVPSQSLEGFGLITLESLACGTPVLVTPVGGLPEAVNPLDPSLVLAGCQVEDIAVGLRHGFSHPLPSRDRCRDYVQSNFSWPVIARQVMSVYQEAAHDSLR
jgi:glycosyltransferase involved in cell wall biosynthesis